MRNFFHDINDIILAVVIVLIAGVIIAWRFSAILEYPAVIAAQNAGDKSVAQDTYNPESN